MFSLTCYEPAQNPGVNHWTVPFLRVGPAMTRNFAAPTEATAAQRAPPQRRCGRSIGPQGEFRAESAASATPSRSAPPRPLTTPLQGTVRLRRGATDRKRAQGVKIARGGRGCFDREPLARPDGQSGRDGFDSATGSTVSADAAGPKFGCYGTGSVHQDHLGVSSPLSTSGSAVLRLCTRQSFHTVVTVATISHHSRYINRQKPHFSILRTGYVLIVNVSPTIQLLLA
jgi:hypothetical protein